MLIKMQSDNQLLAKRNHELLRQAEFYLEQESAHNESMEAKYGSNRWKRDGIEPDDAGLYKQKDEYGTYLAAANKSDSVVGEKLNQWRDIILLLEGDSKDIEQQLPRAKRVSLSAPAENKIEELRRHLNQASRMEARRRRRIEQVREKAKADRIGPVLLQHATALEQQEPMRKLETALFEPVFRDRLNIYEEDREFVQRDSESQARLLEELEQANNEFIASRKGDTVFKEREDALQRLETSFHKYREIFNNSEEGRNFYNQLSQSLSKFRDKCREFTQRRQKGATDQEL